MHSRLKMGALLALVTLAGCSTITNPFVRMTPDFNQLPEEELRTIARQIEEAVAAENRTPEISDGDVIVVNTPEIIQAIRTRAARHEILSEFMDTGFGAETQSSLVTVLRKRPYKQETTNLDRQRYAMVVYNENQNRWALYEGILKASNLPKRSLSAIQAIFLEERIAIMKPGHKYYDQEGNVRAKQ